MAAGLRTLADAVEATPDLLSVAAESMAEDYMHARAPPPEDQVLSRRVCQSHCAHVAGYHHVSEFNSS